MKAWIEGIFWVDEDGDEVEDHSLPRHAFVELPSDDLDAEEFCELVDQMLLEKYKCQPGGWRWEILTKEVIN